MGDSTGQPPWASSLHIKWCRAIGSLTGVPGNAIFRPDDVTNAVFKKPAARGACPPPGLRKIPSSHQNGSRIRFIASKRIKRCHARWRETQDMSNALPGDASRWRNQMGSRKHSIHRLRKRSLAKIVWQKTLGGSEKRLHWYCWDRAKQIVNVDNVKRLTPAPANGGGPGLYLCGGEAEKKGLFFTYYLFVAFP